MKEENKWEFKIPKPKFYDDNSFYWLNPFTIYLIAKFLEKDYERKFNPEETSLKIPMMAQETPIGNWKTAVASSLVEYLNSGIAIYDLNKQNIDYPTFLGKYRALNTEGKQDELVYVLTRTTGVKNAADTYVRGMWINTVDLSGLSDIKELKANFQDIDSDEDRTWKNLVKLIREKIFEGVIYDQISSIHKLTFENWIYDLINSLIIKVGGRLFTNVNSQWTEWIKSELPRDKYEEFGFYTDVSLERKENNWDDWVYDNKTLNESYFWWFSLYKPGEYMTQNRFQKNHILYRNTSPFSGSLFMGASKRSSSIIKKIKNVTYRNWRDGLKQNARPGENIKDLINITDSNDDWYLYNHFYEGRENFDFQKAEAMHKVRALIHLDLYKLIENRGGKRVEINPYKGVMLIPDYENEAYVLAEYEKGEIQEGAIKKKGLNSVLAVSEVLDHVSPVKNYDINNPDEKLLTGLEWQKVSHAIRLGTLSKRLLIPPEEEDKQIKLRFKRWYKLNTNEYSELTEYAYKLHYYIPKIPGRWNWRLTVPIRSEVDFYRLVEKYNDLPDNNFSWIRGDNKENKGIKNVDNYYCPIFDSSQSDFLDTKQFSELPGKIKNSTIFIFVDIYPSEWASNEEKRRLKELIEELHTAFFRSPWTENITYQSSNIPGNVKRMIYKADNPENNIYYWSMSNLRPYRGVWYSSRIIIDEKFEGGYEKSDPWYEKIKKDHIFSWSWTNNHRDGNVINRIGKTLEYKDFENIEITWKGILNHLYTMGQADRLEDTPHGIFTENAISFQENEGYKWHWQNTRNNLSIRLARQQLLAENFICMELIKSKSISYTDKNLENPKSFIPINYHINDLGKLQEFYNRQQQIIPDYVWKYINPQSPISPLHNLDKLTIGEINESSFDLIKWCADKLLPKLNKALTDLHTHLISHPVLFDLVGTNFLALANYDASQKWNFELIIKRNTGVLSKEGRKKCVFTNRIYEEDTVIKAVNSLTELNVYGQTIPLKERFILEGKDLDINLTIEKIPDRHQSPSDWFLFNLKSTVDCIKNVIEVPKEQTIRSNIPLHEKQRLFNEYIYNNADRYWENQKYNLDKEQFFRGIRREERFQVLDGIGDFFGSFNNLLAIKGASLMSSGVIGMMGAGFNIVGGIYNSLTGHWKRTEERRDRFDIGVRNFEIQGQTMAVKHKSAEESNLLSIQNLSINNRLPQQTNSIVFEEKNKLEGRSNVYISRYSPSGTLLEILKHHYEEYGYNIFLDNQSCRGIDDIKKHIQYLTIKQNLHYNETIRAMIERRLLTGVKVID